MGMPVHNLPTAIVSNTLDYGKFNLLDTTDYIKGVFPVWKELGFHFDAIATGFIASEQQADLIARYCREQEATGTAVFVDPIMGDEGKLYNGVTPATINSMREMLSVAHLCYPQLHGGVLPHGQAPTAPRASRQRRPASWWMSCAGSVRSRCSSPPSPSTASLPSSATTT